MFSRLWLKAALAAGVALLLCGDVSAQRPGGGGTVAPPFVGTGSQGVPPAAGNLTPQQQRLLRLIVIRRLAQQQEAQQRIAVQRGGAGSWR
jgi:hypothetical protein